MDRYVSPTLFTVDLSADGKAAASYTVKTATELGFKEKWLQAAIAQTPEIVIAPCREAELTDEQWLLWGREVSTDVGPIDVLLVSTSGRVGIVETKLSYNPEGRRKVVAQILDYAVQLPEVALADLPPLPSAVDPTRVEHRLLEGDFLLIIAGDLLDSRAVKLGRSLLGDHMLNGWDLALVEVAVFERTGAQVGPAHLLVPHLRGLVVPEQRQVVRVVVEGSEQHQVIMERRAPESVDGTRQKWTEERFFSELDASALAPAFKELGQGLRRLATKHATLEMSWGTGKTGSLTLKRQGRGLIEFYLSGNVAVRKEQVIPALGEAAGTKYLEGLNRLFPEPMKMAYPQLKGLQSGALVGDVLALIGQVVSTAQVEGSG